MISLPPIVAELFRLRRTRATWALLLVPALVGVVRIAGGRFADSLARARRVAQDLPVAAIEAESGFAPLADGLRTGAVVLTLLLLVLGALAIVRERESGALGLSFLARSRGAVVLGKAIALGLFALLAFAVLLAACAGAAGWQNGLGPVVEEGFVMASAAELWAETLRGCLATLPALCSVALFGLAVSSMVSSQGAAVALTLVPVVAFDVLKGLFAGAGDYIFVTYAPFLGSASPLAHLTDIARAFSDAEWVAGEFTRATLVPGAEGILLLALAVVVTRVRSA